MNLLFVSIGRRVSQEGRLLFWRWRKSCEVERDPTQQGRLVGLRRWREAFLFKTSEDKSIEWLTRPFALPDCRKGLRFRSNKCPMILPFCTLLDPTPQEFNLLGGQS